MQLSVFVTPTLAIFGYVLCFPPLSGFVFRFVFCHVMHFHIMSSCALHSHTCSSHASEHFPRCPFCNPALLSPPVHPSCFLSCAGDKLSRNGQRLVKWPYYTTRRLPVKFRSIRRSFGTPTVNWVTAKSVCVCSKNPSLNSPKPTKLSSIL